MQHKRKKEENKAENLIHNLHDILDNNYFHVNTEIKDNKVKWSVFYRNLPTSLYYSKENKPLLTSEKNMIADIYLLKDIFEKIKTQEAKRNIYSLYNDGFKYFSDLSEMKFEGSTGMLNIFAIYSLLNIIFLEVGINKFTAILNLCVSVFIVFYFYFKSKKMSKLLEKRTDENIDLLLKNHMKYNGVSIYRKIKNELYKNKI